jgi:glycosyltransferase involved in cell wall biosynthesis
MPRVLQIIPTLDRGGAEKQLTLLATGLPRDAFDVHVCLLTRLGPLAERLEAAGIPYTCLDKRGKLDPAAWARLERHIRSLRPDLVHTWIFAANAYGRAAALSAGVRCVVGGERSVDPWKRWHELAIDRWLARRSAAIITNSSGVRDFYASHGVPADLFRIIPNGIPAAKPAPQSRGELLAELGLPADAKLIGAVGRLWPQKRMSDLVWSADQLRILREDFHLLIIGEGPLRKRLERYIAQNELEHMVHLLGERADVERLMPHFDVVCLASEYEGMPNVLLEAMAAGVPVVASDIPGNRDVVVDGQTGYLVRVGHVPGFTKRLHELLEDPALAAKLGAAGRERVLQEFSVERMIERHASVYRELLG